MIIKTDDRDGNVIRIDFTKAPNFAVKPSGREPCLYEHKPLTLDPSTRNVACSTCGAIVDPFEALLRFAKEEQHFIWNRDELRQLQTGIGELKDETRAVKAKLRTARQALKKLEGGEDASKFRQRRMARGMSLRQLAAAAGMAAIRVGEIERGLRQPTSCEHASLRDALRTKAGGET